jgi:hypothetical protein
MAAVPDLGDLVVCSSKAFRESARLGLDVGLYLVDRKKDGLVFFARPDRSEWIPKTALKTMAPDDPRVVPPPAWVVTVNRMARLLDAIELDLERDDDGRCAVKIGCAGLDRQLLGEVERTLGDEASRGLQIRPGSMSRIRLIWHVALGSD